MPDRKNERNSRKDASIETILDQGLLRPISAGQHIRGIVSALGIRHIFWDTSFSLCFTALTLVTILLCMFLVTEDFSHTAAVGIAPALFLLLTLFAETSERMEGFYELKQTCRHTIRQITAVRMMCYSAAGSVFTSLTAVAMADNAQEFFTLLPLSLSALFICAVIQLFVLRLVRLKWALEAVSAVWVVMALAVPFTLGARWELFLREFPVGVGVVIFTVSMGLFVIQIRKMLMEVNRYAVT